MAISTDRVDAARVTHPQGWDIKQIRRYMIVFGLLSSAFDLLTFAALLLLFHAGEATFQTTWFVVSLLTELRVVLVLHPGARLAQPAERPPSLDDGRRHSVRSCDTFLRARVDAVRFRPALDGRDGHRRRHRHRLPGCDRIRQTLV